MSGRKNPPRCTLCGHLYEAHEVDEQGNRPCRSIGHPDGVPCAECRRLVSEDNRESVVQARGKLYSGDPVLAATWGAYKTMYDHVRNLLGDGWRAFFTDLHQSALMAALLEYERERLAEAHRALVPPQNVTWPDMVRLLREKIPARLNPQAPLEDVQHELGLALQALMAVLEVVGPVVDSDPEAVGAEEWNLAAGVVSSVLNTLVPE